jgi:hypothetical protein
LADSASGQYPYHAKHVPQACLPLERMVVTVGEHGNTSAASIPLAFDVAVRDGRIKRGQRADRRRRRRLHVGRVGYPLLIAARLRRIGAAVVMNRVISQRHHSTIESSKDP